MSCFLVLGALVFAAPASAQQDCRFLRNCEEDTPPPPPPPPLDPCPSAWQTASRTNSIAGYNRYLRQCSSHSRAREARNRISNLRTAANRAVRVRQCNSRHDELTRLASKANGWSSIGDAQFKRRITTWNSECASITGRTTTGKIAQAGERATLNVEMQRWGLTYTQMCGLPMEQVLLKAGATANRQRIRNSAASGDSVAQLLNAELILREGKFAQNVRGQARVQYSRAQARNPRAKVQLAIENLERLEPNVAAADRLLRQSMEANCGDAFYVAAMRVWGSYNVGDKPGEFDRTKDQLLERSNVYGGTRALCTLATYGKANGEFVYNWEQRRSYLSRARALGDPCGRRIMALYGEPGRIRKSQPARGLCANNRDCIRRELSQAFAARDYSSWAALYDFLTLTNLGGGRATYAQANRALGEAADNGDVAAMSWMGELTFFGYYGLTKYESVAFSRCSNAANRGSPRGAACAYFASSKPEFGTIARDKNPCSLMWMAKNAMPRLSGDISTIQQSTVLTALNAMSAQKRADLKRLLPKVEFALAAAAQSGKSCAKEGQDFSRVVRQFVRPYYFPPRSASENIVCSRTAAGNVRCVPAANSNSSAQTPLPVARPLAPPPPPPPPPPPRPTAARCNTGPYIVFFDWGIAALPRDATTVLDALVSNYARCGVARVNLAGHTDRSGTAQYNLGLSARKNASVRSYLISRGIPANRILSRSFGESQPRIATADGVREAQNRRVEITIQP